MIVKHILARKNVSNITELTRYIIGMEGEQDPRSWFHTADYVLRNDLEEKKVGAIRVTNCGTSDPKAAMFLIQSTQAFNNRSKSTKTYHMVFSFLPGEQPSLDILHAIEDELCISVGFSEHQRISAVHTDKPHLHVHVIINKIHPTGYQNVEPYYDQKKLRSACKLLEVKYGLKRSHEILPPSVNGKFRDIGQKIKDIEAFSGVETLAHYIAKNLGQEIRNAKSWQEIHVVLRKHGLAIKPRGAGLVMGDVQRNLWVRASQCGRDFSMMFLTQRLGNYKKRKGREIKQEGRYIPKPVQKNSPEREQLFSEYQKEKKKKLEVRKLALEDLKKEKEAWSILFSPKERRLKSLELKKHGNILRQQRDIIYKKTKLSVWNDWLVGRFVAGDSYALRVLCQKEDKRRFEEENIFMVHNHKNTRLAVVLFKEFYPFVQRDGSIFYGTKDGGFVLDQKNLIVIRKVTPEASLLALKLAERKFQGQPLIVEGSYQFKKQVVKLAIKYKIVICFFDQKMEERRKKALVKDSEFMKSDLEKSVKRVCIEVKQVMESKNKVLEKEAKKESFVKFFRRKSRGIEL